MKKFITAVLFAAFMCSCATPQQMRAMEDRLADAEGRAVRAEQDANARKNEAEAAHAANHAKDALRRATLTDSKVAAYTEEMLENRNKFNKLKASGNARSYRLDELDARYAQLKQWVDEDEKARIALGIDLANVEAIVDEHSVVLDDMELESSDTADILSHEYNATPVSN